MFYIPKALYDIMTEKQQKTLMDLQEDIFSSIKSVAGNSYNQFTIQTAFGRIVIPASLVFIDNNTQNSGVLDHIIETGNSLNKDKAELQKLRELKASVETIKKHFKE